MRFKRIFFTISTLTLFLSANAFSQRGKAAAKPAVRSFSVFTEPGAQVWLNGVLRGTTDAEGKILIRNKLNGALSLRVRADGFSEFTKPVAALNKADVKIALQMTTDEAELAFQAAEKSTDHSKAVELYQKAIKLRPKYAEAFLGLARALNDSGKSEDAHDAIAAARKLRPIYPEASAVEGRIFRSEGDEEKMIGSFKRAIREGKGFQPEAHTGLALHYKEQAEFEGGSGGFEEETRLLGEAAKEFRLAIDQLSGAPDAITVYQFFGLVYENMKMNKEAIAVYEEFLEFFPESSEATAIRSFIVQLKRPSN